MFLQGTICVSARVGKSFAKFSLVDRKKYVSGYVWHRTFIEMVKYSFLDERIVYQSFNSAPHAFNFFFKKSFLFRNASPSRLLNVYLCEAFRKDPCRKNEISSSIWQK